MTPTASPAAELTDEQIAQEEAFMRGLPRVNWGALLLPPVWGAGHGMMPTILFYPAWLLADNCFYAAWAEPTPLSVAVAAVVLAILVAVTVGFALVSQPLAAHRAESMGVDRATYLRRERRWAVGCAIGGAAMIALATYYNLAIRPTVGM